MSKNAEFATPSLPVRAFFAVKAGITDPGLLCELAAKFVKRLWTAEEHSRRVAEYSQYSVSDRIAIAAVTSATEAEIDAVLNERALSEIRDECLGIAKVKNVGQYTWGGFAELCYAICRLNKPENVLETGVAFGWTSAFILAALEVNGRGHLHSVDMPAFRPGAERITGTIVPHRLRHRWTLLLGSQRQQLPAALAQLNSVDFFHYDSDKTYQGMKSGYESVWPKLTRGGVLMSDDVDNDAFLEFCTAKQQTPIVVVKPLDDQRVALIRRS